MYCLKHVDLNYSFLLGVISLIINVKTNEGP